jgi:hypothetical protein
MYTHETLTVDSEKETKSLLYDEELRGLLPTLEQSFESIDNEYLRNRIGYLNKISTGQFDIEPTDGGRPVRALLTMDQDTVDSNDIMVLFAPFSDGPPASNPRKITSYIDLAIPNFADKQAAQPHSYNQATKSGVIHDLLKAEGFGMPVVTIFSPIPPKAYSAAERAQYRRGDFRPASHLAQRAIEQVQDYLHGPNSETQIDTTHYNGASLGASNAIASAAAQLQNDRYRVGSVTAQELPLGAKHLPDLAYRFIFKKMVGEPSDGSASADGIYRLHEPQVRQEIDAHGNELQMFARIGKGILRIGYLQGLTHAASTVQHVNQLTAAGVPTTIAVGENSSMSKDTLDHFSHDLLADAIRVIRVRGIEGQRAGHPVDEHVAATATIALRGVMG